MEMDRRTIVFTAPGIAQLQTERIPYLDAHSVLLKTEYTVISPGTERANLMGERNISGERRKVSEPRFPKTVGYCGVGRVVQVGSEVTSVSTGDRAVIYFGVHSSYNVVPEQKVIKIEDEGIDSREAAATVLAHISLGGVRMARLEIGESVLVMGLGILGMYAVQFCRLNGAYPIIAADPDPARRSIASQHGADFVFHPEEDGFSEKVLEVTKGRGVNAVIEVSGAAPALPQALECTARMGRIVLLGCTRENDIPTDYYHMVHYPGVQILGAHTFVRPAVDSRPGYWTYQDECRAILNLISGGRICLKSLIDETQLPEAAPEVFQRLAQRKEFPLTVMFDWRGME